MSMQGFMHGGLKGHLLTEERYLPHILKDERIKIYDIDDPALFGAIYPDSARLAMPRSWFPVAERNYARLKSENQLFPPTLDGQPSKLPRIRLR